MICPVCRHEVFLQGGGGGWLHRKPPTYHHDIGTPIEGEETPDIKFVIGNGDVIGSLDEALMGEGQLPGTRHNLIQRIAEIGLKFVEKDDPKNHCQCKVCQEICERCKEIAHG